MSYPPSIVVRVIGSAFQIFGVICTTWRIYFRLRIHRFWWEDAWAIIALFSCIASLVGQWTFTLTHNISSDIGFGFYAIGFTSVVRATHLSILFSITRFIHETRVPQFTCLFTTCCGILWAVFVAAKVWKCASDPFGRDSVVAEFDLQSPMLLFEFTSDCLSVVILVALPLCMFWRIKLPRRQRRMILCIFASSTVLAFAVVIQVVGLALGITMLAVAGIEFEIAASIIVCNLLVVVTCAYRYLWHDEKGASTSETDADVDDFTVPTGTLQKPARSELSTGTLTVTESASDSSASITSLWTTHISIPGSFPCTDSNASSYA